VVEVLYTDEFEAWWGTLRTGEQQDVDIVVRLLQEQGVTLGWPYSSAIQGSRFALRELRVQSSGHPLRVFYAFDPWRDAVLLIGGDKTGDGRFYDWMIPKAETILVDYLTEETERRKREK
jgi:hypothetical protein